MSILFYNISILCLTEMRLLPSIYRRRPIQTVTLSLFRFDSTYHKCWAFVMMGLARPMLKRIHGLTFWKLLGSGTGQGFTPIPNWGVYGILGVWASQEDAERGTAKLQPFTAYRTRAAESATLFLKVSSARGKWSGALPFNTSTTTHSQNSGPVAILTRATVKWQKIPQFWRHSPEISTRIGNNTDVMFKIGLGEVPLRQQLTFSVWPDIVRMAEFAHQNGPHHRAIQQVRKGNWFKEELYARFNIISIDGHWSDFDATQLSELPS